jgi:TPP-dependent pyruvate/acetoin dehydrogenase alpha subunit
MEKITKEQLIEFEKRIVKRWENAEIPYPVHFCGGNEEQLIEIFKDIKEGDYIFSTHRSHYHYLLAGGLQKELEEIIMKGDSMHVFNREKNFFTSSIVCGVPTIAVGVALALKRNNDKRYVWCFVGDGAEDEGHFYEAVRYADGHNLPCKFIIEDNNRSVETPKANRYGTSKMNWPDCVFRYEYTSTYPHVGTGNFINFNGSKGGGNSF